MKFNIFKKKKRHSHNDPTSPLLYGLNDVFDQRRSLTLSAVYRAIELKSNAVASIPIEIYNTNLLGEKIKYSKINDLSYILNERPDSRMDAFTFWKMIVTDLDINGNGYAIIDRGIDGIVNGLIYVPANLVSIVNADMIFEDPIYFITGSNEGNFSHENIIHIRNYTTNGVTGISTLTYARNTLSLAYNTEHSANRTFQSGGKLSGVYTVNEYLDEEKRSDIEDSWKKTFSDPDSSGVAILEQGNTFTPIQLNNKDLMMIESRQFNVVDIARFFNVSPILLYDYSKMSYSGLEQTMLEFLSTTIQPILSKIEKELNYKLLDPSQRYKTHIKFDTTNFIKTDKITTANFYSKLFNAGVLSVNEIRNELGYKDIENGNDNYVQVNLMKVGESGMDNSDGLIDNKLNQDEEDL